MIKKIIKKLITKCGYDIKKINPEVNEKFLYIPKEGLTYAEDFLYTYHNADFINDPLFIESYNLGKETDKLGLLLKNNNIRWRIHVLCWAASHGVHLEGDFVDCGVNTGIFSRSIINYIDFETTGKTYYLLDTFTGLEPNYSTEKEMEKNRVIGYTRQNQLYEEVCQTFKGFNVEIIKGAVPDTLSQVKSNKICFLSIDMNCVIPEIEALEFFWDKMVKGGLIILDDYGFVNSTNDQKEAHDKFAESKGVMILTLPTCQGLIIKP
jgi:O-methyltransferase